MSFQGFAPKQTVQWSEVGSEVVILDREMGELLRLNSVAGFVWKQLDGQRSVDEIVQEVCGAFAVDQRLAEQDVRRLLKKLVKLEIVEAQKQ